MSSVTIKPKNLETELVSYSEKPSVLDSGAKYVWVGYKGKNMVVQTPYMEVPFGLSKYDKGDYPKYSLELSFKGVDDNKDIKSLYEKLSEIDEKLVEDGVKNSMAWFKKKNAKKDVVQAMFNPVIKVPTDKDSGEELTQYPKRMRLKVPFKDDKFDCEVFDTEGQPIDKPLDEVFVRGAKVKAIIQCVGLWISSGNYNCQWKLVRCQVDVPKTGSNDFLPDSDSEDEN